MTKNERDVEKEVNKWKMKREVEMGRSREDDINHPSRQRITKYTFYGMPTPLHGRMIPIEVASQISPCELPKSEGKEDHGQPTNTHSRKLTCSSTQLAHLK